MNKPTAPLLPLAIEVKYIASTTKLIGIGGVFTIPEKEIKVFDSE